MTARLQKQARTPPQTQKEMGSWLLGKVRPSREQSHRKKWRARPQIPAIRPRVIWEPSLSLPGFLPAHWSRLSGAAQIRLLGLAVRAFCEPMPGLYSLPCGVWCQTETGLWFRVKMALSAMSLHPDLLHWHHDLCPSPVPTPSHTDLVTCP